MFEFKAEVRSNTRGLFIPKIDNSGQVSGTTLQYNLKLKIGCRVMLTWNIDVCDLLTNGSQGQVIDFNRDSNDKVKYIMIKFDDPNSGKERRQQYKFINEYQEEATPIELLEIEFRVGKESTATALAVNFPLRLAYASTAHRIQGHTVKKPNNLILDLKCWLEPAMIYVMLSRVQCLNQLYILESLPDKKMNPFPEAVEELERLVLLDINKPKKFNILHLNIISLNTRSLMAHMKDIQDDKNIMTADIICLQETWLSQFENQTEHISIQGKEMELNNRGRGKGIATYYPADFTLNVSISDDRYQITSISSKTLTIINLYRSSNSDDTDFIQSLDQIISNNSKSIIIFGDFNFCQREESNHEVIHFFKKNNFLPGFNPPLPSHIGGRCLDQVYFKFLDNIKMEKIHLNPCYFSDHDKVQVTVLQESNEDAKMDI